jgi:CDP-diacylglycerol--glycerol-3-phosphate 3-phosphatidyltransferase
LTQRGIRFAFYQKDTLNGLLRSLICSEECEVWNWVMKIKYAASLITIGRIIGAFVLLLTKPQSVLFFVVYALCCVSDVLDGYVARKTKTASRCGEVLDSIADFIFIAIVLIIFIPLLAWDRWAVYWLAIIALTRFLSLGIGFAKYRAMSFLHTYANKFTGVALVCFPVLYRICGMTATVFFLCCLASLSALEELTIIIRSKELNRNIKSIFAQDGTPIL